MRNIIVPSCHRCPYFREGMLRGMRCALTGKHVTDIGLKNDGLDEFRISKSCPLKHHSGQGGLGDDQERLDIYPVKAVMELVPERITRQQHNSGLPKEFDGHEIYFASDNLRLYKRRGTRCVGCGVEARYFAKERVKPGDRWQLRLYAIDYDGLEVLMTKDHIKPRSRHGRTKPDNLQPMCVKCNELKGNRGGRDETREAPKP